jgi:hypothetical protein
MYTMTATEQPWDQELRTLSGAGNPTIAVAEAYPLSFAQVGRESILILCGDTGGPVRAAMPFAKEDIGFKGPHPLRARIRSFD